MLTVYYLDLLLNDNQGITGKPIAIQLKGQSNLPCQLTTREMKTHLPMPMKVQTSALQIFGHWQINASVFCSEGASCRVLLPFCFYDHNIVVHSSNYVHSLNSKWLLFLSYYPPHVFAAPVIVPLPLEMVVCINAYKNLGFCLKDFY